MNRQEYTMKEIEKTITLLKETFDIVRVVDPITAREYIFKDGTYQIDEYKCYAVWLKGERCRNCISSRCIMHKCMNTKFEFIDQDIYYVMAKYITVEGMDLVLEIVSNVSDTLMLEALGENEFVSHIASFNQDAYTDALTGLSNRRDLDEQLFIMNNTAVGEKSSLAVLMIDLDNLKIINDTMGHSAGDDAIRIVGDVLRKSFSFKNKSIEARYGGDEFTVCARDVTKEEIVESVQEVFERLKVVKVGDYEIPVTLSVGIYYQSTAKDCKPDELLKMADKELYNAKKASKNTWNLNIV